KQNIKWKTPPLSASSLRKKSINQVSIFCESRVLLPHLVSDGINRYAFSFRQEEDDKQGHNKNPCREEDEDVGSHVAKHGKESLCDQKGEQHVGTNGKGEPCCSGFHGENFTGYEPSKGTP
ncbi:hypothetical protein KSS87_003944, partial [Heliosperma pusillum]